MTDQNRDAPAYQEYAATILSKLPFRTMTLQDRGLLYTMRLECWVNKKLPATNDDLSKALGFTKAEINSSLPTVMAFFEVVGCFIVCPELENYRQYLDARRAKQSAGGKHGAAITNSKTNSGKYASNSRVTRRDSDESLVQYSTTKPSLVQYSQTQSLNNADTNDTFITDYEAADYARASGHG